jgi:hypothetical protein
MSISVENRLGVKPANGVETPIAMVSLEEQIIKHLGWLFQERLTHIPTLNVGLKTVEQGIRDEAVKRVLKELGIEEVPDSYHPNYVRYGDIEYYKKFDESATMPQCEPLLVLDSSGNDTGITTNIGCSYVLGPRKTDIYGVTFHILQ